MLYPNFKELISFKKRKKGGSHPSNRKVASSITGNHASPFRGQGLEFDAVREYVPGDDIRNIDWRVTARTGSPHLKLFKEDREREIILCIDVNSSMRFGTKKTFKSVMAAKVAAFLGWKGIANHDCVSSLLYGDVPTGLYFFSAEKSQKSFSSFLKMLSEKPAESHEVSLEKAFNQLSQTSKGGSLLYVISDFLDIDADFHKLPGVKRVIKKCDVVFISVNDRADQEIFPVSGIKFFASSLISSFLNTDNQKGREHYAEQWKESRQILKTNCAKLKIPLIELTTESDMMKDLPWGLKTLQKRSR